MFFTRTYQQRMRAYTTKSTIQLGSYNGNSINGLNTYMIRLQLRIYQQCCSFKSFLVKISYPSFIIEPKYKNHGKTLDDVLEYSYFLKLVNAFFIFRRTREVFLSSFTTLSTLFLPEDIGSIFTQILSF